nr:FixH family protein [Evansella tamaricis]
MDVELSMPEEGDPDTEIVIQALVTQGEEKVNDASEVIFEIWKQGQKEESEFVDATEPIGDGVYEITYIFTEEYIYFVQPHVTARGMHMMPVGEIIIGDVPENLLEEQDENTHEHDNGDHADHGEGHHHDMDHSHHHEDLRVDWLTAENIEQSNQTELSVYVEWQDAPLRNGDIQFEIWQDGDERHTWLPAEESEEGTYVANHTFERTGDYNIQIHVEDDTGLHEHIQFVIQVDHSH